MKISVSILFSLIIGSIIIALTTCKSVTPSNYKSIVLSAIISNWTQDSGTAYLSVTATLSNNTSKDTSFIIMSCSWEDFFSLDTKDLFIVESECNKNVPERVHLLSNSTKQFNLKLITQANDRNFALKFRIGFNWLPISDGEDVIDKYLRLKDKRNIIWSDTLLVRSK
jgi:hypothetical protein